ncbi:M23 family metallopeptidase [Thiovibrio sp. JS02]
MDNKLHFVVTGERGGTRSFVISKDFLRLTVLICCFFLFSSVVGWFFVGENVFLRHRSASLAEELGKTISLNRSLQASAARQEKEQEARLHVALAELKQRSQIIQAILSTVGVELEVNESAEGTGGPYTRAEEDSYAGLTLMVDHYLAAIQSVPLGPPAPGVITSRFGRRIDPINDKPAFHSGVDIRNRRGTKIIAPADGVVVSDGYTPGYGNYIEIDHGNTFLTRYFHLHKKQVKSGDRIARGQVIGQVGNTGRSTGAHLHYEIRYRDRFIDPTKFIQISSHVAAYLRKQAADVEL